MKYLRISLAITLAIAIAVGVVVVGNSSSAEASDYGTVPKVVSLSKNTAQQRIYAAGFRPYCIPVDNVSAPVGTVFKQSPQPGTQKAMGSYVYMYYVRTSTGVSQIGGISTTTTTAAQTTTTTGSSTTTTRPTATTTTAWPTTTTTQTTSTTLPPASSFNLQNAINSAAAGSTVNVPAGTYSGAITVNKSIKLIGAGQGRTVIKNDSGYVMTVNAASFELSDVTIQGNYNLTTQVGLHLVYCPSVSVHDVTIKDVGFCGIINGVGGSVSGTFTRLSVSHIGDFGIQMRRGATNIRVTDSTWSGFASRLYPGHAIYFDDVNGGYVARHTISNLPAGPGGNEISGVKITRESDTPNTGITVEDVKVDSAIAVVSLPYAKNVLVQRCQGSNIYVRGYYLLVGGDNLTLNSCTVDDAPIGFAYWGALPTNSQIVNCTATNCYAKSNIPSSSVHMSGNNW